jgi:hypothetical protein
MVMVTCGREGWKWRIEKERVYSRGKSGGSQTRQRAQVAPAAWSKIKKKIETPEERDRPAGRNMAYRLS